MTGECTAWASDKTLWDDAKLGYEYLVTNMNSVFDYEYTFNGDISNWDTSQVTDMYGYV